MKALSENRRQLAENLADYSLREELQIYSAARHLRKFGKLCMEEMSEQTELEDVIDNLKDEEPENA